MQEVIVMGPLIIKVNWIYIAISVLAAYVLMKHRLLEKDEIGNRIMDDLVHAGIMALIIWKFSLILFNPVDVIKNPYALLYFTGGDRGVWLSVICALGFIYYQSRKQRLAITMYAEAAAVGFVAYYAVYSSMKLTEHTHVLTLDLVRIGCAFMLLIGLLRKNDDIKKGEFAIWKV
ncbi:hypothetical protein [Paenibacillus sp. NPDC058071]|uniref:hypothetical protein n=1 Tax=Paenibacillus sp. NPDC058071 TaxID=3346326 RepID=UPI0036DD04CD